MPKWTNEQQMAISKEGKNIIVSAGAGSGKTAVLTARVIRKLKDGIDIDKLLVLTFTNEASNEMKNRIRKAIFEEPSLKKQLDYIDSSYITTFDSYAFSVVRKYHYVLGIPKDISIIDSSVINIKKEEFLEEIFNDLYESKDEAFLKMISDFTVKDDKEIKTQIFRINNSLDLKYDKDSYLDKYLDSYYNKDYVDKLISDYLEVINHKKEEIIDIYKEILLVEEDKKIEEYKECFKKLLEASNYLEIKQSLDISMPRIVKYSKELKQSIKEKLEELKKFTFFNSVEEVKETYLSTYSYVKVILDIIKKLDDKVNSYKQKNNVYEFTDIAKMAIEIVKNNKEIREEIKNFYNEIMIDEYQDTNDLQEMFIKEIENDNVYMVGDIKQSIYRFRNANPFIFKEKYDLYSDGDYGIKIDLLKNFRSREEVLSDINKIFIKVMSDFLGGADYEKSHQMVFGNTNYNLEKTDFSNFLEIYNYDDKLYKEFTKNEKEAFIIAQDIKNKINNNYMVIDKESGTLRKVRYDDFCIIMDRGTDFDLYRKIFEYENIPLSIYKDEVLNTEYDILIIKNLINFVIKIKNKEYGVEFRYLFTSIARSYLFRLSDEEIFKCFKDNSFYDLELFKLGKEVSDTLDEVSCQKFLDELLEKFNFWEKVLSYRNTEETMIRILYLKNITKSLENLGYTPYDLGEYLSKMIDDNNDIKYKANTNSANSVKIMNIHKSKGLEFPVCYYAGLYKKFNIRDITEKFLYDKKYGIITPYYKEGVGTVFSKLLVKEDYIKEEISEKIRLFYVALTRAKEKMIFVCPLDKDVYYDERIIQDDKKLKYRSFLDIVNSVQDLFDREIKDISFEEVKLSKDYNIFKDKDFEFLNSSDELIDKREVSINSEMLSDNHFSKVNNKLKTKEELENMEFGTYMHYLFEVSDFSKTDNKYVKRFLKHDLFKNINEARVFKEYEFIYEDDGDTYHGVIDLMLEYEDYVDIVDYKLLNIDDDNYRKQLNGYKDYIFKKTNKPVNIYLYSIEKDIIKKL